MVKKSMTNLPLMKIILTVKINLGDRIMDKIDKMLIEILKSDSRTTVKEISAMLNITASEATNRISNLEKNGVIVKYTTVINTEMETNDSVVALIEVKVTPQSTHGFDSIAREIMAYQEVSSVYLMSGAYDLVVIIEGKSLREVASFVSEKLSVMDNVISTATHFILKKYKSEGIVLDNCCQKQREELV